MMKSPVAMSQPGHGQGTNAQHHVAQKYFEAFQQSFPELNQRQSSASMFGGNAGTHFSSGFQLGGQIKLEEANQKVPVCFRNFVTCPPQHSLIELTNQDNVKLNYCQAQVEKTTEHLSTELKAIWENIRDITGQSQLGSGLLANETDEALRSQYRGEYETWQLVNELISAEKLYFEKGKERAGADKTQLCPKTLEYETLVGSHATSIVHSVALWLEKIYQVDSKPQMSQFDINSAAQKSNFDEVRSMTQDQEHRELNTLKALYEMLRAGKVTDAQMDLMKNGQNELLEMISGG